MVLRAAGGIVRRHSLMRWNNVVIEPARVVIRNQEERFPPSRPGSQRLIDILHKPLAKRDLRNGDAVRVSEMDSNKSRSSIKGILRRGTGDRCRKRSA